MFILLGLARFILIICGIVALALLFLLVIPLHFTGEVKAKSSTVSFNTEAKWGWGLLRFRASKDSKGQQHSSSFLGFRLAKTSGKSVRSSDAQEAQSENTNGQATDLPRESGTVSILPVVRKYLNKDLLEAVIVLVKGLFRSLHLGRVMVAGSFGLDDPAETAWVLGLSQTLKGMISWIKWDIEPVFEESYLDIRLQCRGWLVPLQVIVVIISFVLYKSVRGLWLPAALKKFSLRRGVKRSVKRLS